MASNFRKENKRAVKERVHGSLLAGVLNAGGRGERTPGDMRLFADMLFRTRHIFARKKIKRARRGTALPLDKPAPEQSAFDEKDLRIVCVGSRLNVWENPDFKMEKFRDGVQLLQAGPELKLKKWVKARIRELEKALELDPHIVCFPEFAYPPPSHTSEGGWTLDEIKDAVERRMRFERKAIELLKGRDTFVCLGSFHCPMTLYNVGVIYPWGEHREGLASYTLPRSNVSPDKELIPYLVPVQEKVEAPILYRKRFPARKIGENARVPPQREVNVFECRFGKVLVLICSDLLDLNQFLHIVDEGTNQRDFDFIVVPAFNPGKSFGDICRDLSGLAANTVVMCGASDKSVTLTPSEIYVCGEDSKKLPVSSYPEHREIIVKTEVLPVEGSKSTLHLFQLDWAALKRARESQLDRLDLGGGPVEGEK